MHKLVAKILGIIIALLAVVGFFIEGELLFGLMNVDLAMDIARTVLAIVLLYVGFGPPRNEVARATVGVVGGVYIVMALVTFIDPTHFGLLNTEFTGFDIGFHLIVGAAAIILAFLPSRTLDPERSEATVDPRHRR
jgi:hypothetical protein